ncbi:MAG: hypothetical protein U1A27_02565 [Phycisphaerae bacterium]
MLLWLALERMDCVPSRMCVPLKVVVRTMRSIDSMAESIWAWLAAISEADRPPELELAAASDSTCDSRLLISLTAPSATPRNELARWALPRAASVAVSSPSRL